MPAVQPKTRYARCSEDTVPCHIAYQELGDGPEDIVFMSAWFSHVDGRWEEPRFAAMLRRIASFGRLLVFDKRGSGASDPLPTVEPTWEDWADDVRAVMDAAGSERATVIGVGDSGPFAMLFAATYPQRVRSLVLVNTGARLVRDADYPWGMSADDVEEFLERAQESWGTGGLADVFAPSVAGDTRYAEWWAKYQRMSASPGRSAAMARLIFQIDARRVLGAIHVPTLVVHRRDYRFFPVEMGRYVAEHIAGAKFIEVPGADGFVYLGDAASILDPIEEFVTGAKRAPDVDRVLATVLLTDIVGSTDLAGQLGDHRWRTLLDTHDDVIRRALVQYRGTLHRTTGDGMLATFDGPARAIRSAFAIRQELADADLPIRAGLHTGEVELRGQEIGGINVHIAARISALAGRDEVLCSRTVKDLVTGSEIRFEPRGIHELKGVQQAWEVYAVAQ
jgi:pimeloyl-ACP methyl ester carboxylesterase/class 3 adenylate cyclase